MDWNGISLLLNFERFPSVAPELPADSLRRMNVSVN